MSLRKGAASAVVGLLGFVPVLALAQCAMPGMSHGGHENHESPAPKRKAPSKELRAVLADEKHRAELLEAVTADPDFMRALVERIARAPEWSALMRERLAEGVGSPEPTPEENAPSDVPQAGHQH